MKTWEELLTVLRNELDQWFIKQCRNPFGDWYLYYQETTPEHDGGILFLQEAPPNKDWKLAWPIRVNKGATVDQNHRYFADVCRRLPVLSPDM